MDEHLANDWLRDRREHWDPKTQVVDNLHYHARRGFSKSPNHIHPFSPGFEMMKTDLASVSIDYLLRGPCYGKAEPGGRHDDEVPVRASFQITNVAVVRQDLRPELEIRRGLEDQVLRSVNNDRVASVHGDLQTMLGEKQDNERKSNNGVTNEIRVRKVRAKIGAAKRGL